LFFFLVFCFSFLLLFFLPHGAKRRDGRRRGAEERGRCCPRRAPTAPCRGLFPSAFREDSGRRARRRGPPCGPRVRGPAAALPAPAPLGAPGPPCAHRAGLALVRGPGSAGGCVEGCGGSQGRRFSFRVCPWGNSRKSLPGLSGGACRRLALSRSLVTELPVSVRFALRYLRCCIWSRVHLKNTKKQEETVKVKGCLWRNRSFPPFQRPELHLRCSGLTNMYIALCYFCYMW